MRSSSNRKEGCRVASPLSPRSVEATESALGLLPSIALSSAQFLLIIRAVRWRSLTAAGRSGIGFDTALNLPPVRFFSFTGNYAWVLDPVQRIDRIAFTGQLGLS